MKKAILGLVLLVASNASAAVIDLTGSAFNGCNGQTSCTVGIPTGSVTITAAPGVAGLTDVLRKTGEGIGVDSGVADPGNEIGITELVTMTFSVDQQFVSITLQQLFAPDNPGNDEFARIRVFNNGIQVGSNISVTGDVDGTVTYFFNPYLTGDELRFDIRDGGIQGLLDDYSVSEIQVVPEPSTYALIGFGCVAFAVLRRRTARK